jgi:hypothetical protein
MSLGEQIVAVSATKKLRLPGDCLKITVYDIGPSRESSSRMGVAVIVAVVADQTTRGRR